MQLILRFAKSGDKGETIREITIPVRSLGTAHFNWHEAVTTAIFHAKAGERIVALIIEGHSNAD